ncbi:Os12g0182900 [Oryza sativa Japonica Group]|uniref:Os12g0182900 protein n=1 Tax=Oryza sativa subsp. japonica TaxID=39947 RepID=A0A0P0Y7S1_ORYSJ|nr:Os12g0182900 [Oryza sativa Japonica Group]
MLMVCSSRLYILAMDGLPKLTAKELKSQRARERYTALSVEEKAALVQRNRENRERKNSASTSGTVLNQSLHEGSQTVNCQPSFQPVPSSTPMSSSTPGNIPGRFVINTVKQESCLLPIRPPY